MPDFGLDQDEECQENGAGGNEAPGFGGIPAVLGVGEAVDEGPQAEGCQNDAGPVVLVDPWALLSLTRDHTPKRAMAAIGTFTKKHQRQLTCSVKNPPSRTPAAAPTPVMEPKIANAVPRSFPPGKATVSSAKAAGASSAANTPCSARAPISSQGCCAMPPTRDATAKPTAATRNVRLRPQKSAIRPPSSRKAPKASA